MSDLIQLNRVVKAYIRIRDKIKEVQNSVKEPVANFKREQDELKAYILSQIDALGLESVKTPDGTAFVSTGVHVRVEDWEKFLTFIANLVVEALVTNSIIQTESAATRAIQILESHGPWAFFKKDVPKDTVLEYMNDTGGEVPPGILLTKVRDIQVRAPRAK